MCTRPTNENIWKQKYDQKVQIHLDSDKAKKKKEKSLFIITINEMK